MALHAFDENQISTIVRSDYNICLYLGPFHEHISSIGADIYLQYRDDEGPSNLWVGDLHIDDINNVANVADIGEMISWARLKDKIAECCQEHLECREEVKRALPRGFRVIDITRRRIVKTSNASFVALSYVWGKDTRSSLLTATRATISAMERDGGLPASEMPRTIEDAMTICTQLGLRYLWADRLCIIQDDPEDKMNQIEAMNDVYSSALLVLVAAYGNNMDFGIHGISRPRPMVQHHEGINGLRITNVLREPEENPLALWHTRGWTYQEAVCARRRLHFTNIRAYFECRSSIFHEDEYNLETELNEFTSYGLFLEEESPRFQTFARHLKNYSSRSLSYRSDTYNAFIGIAKLIYGPNYTDTFINGLPKVDFDRALRWYSNIGKSTLSRLETPDIICPTWSWSSAMSHSDDVRYQETELYGALTLWYRTCAAFLPEDAQLEAVNIHTETKMDEGWEIYMAISCAEGCVRNAFTSWSLKTNTFSTVRETFSARWPNYHTFCKDALQSPELSQWSEYLDISVNDIKQGAILTIAQTAFLRLGERPSKNYGLGILDSEGNVVGELCGEVTQLREEVISAQYVKNNMYEFISFSLSGLHIRPYSGKERETKNYSDMDGKPLSMLPIVNLLMIGRRGKCAYRRELGWIYLKDWVKADREWNTVIIE
ncbi:HET-domain-containing protein [Lepidopterella palustris CBS 459.81]|uniref:HET-domain-containing protein n=1 Tax=Lepidopterella palustris CBS 459.81 TaxID=1314670 RepID=A0A8E2E486_9PEZI|nr:HET-domain-containing protein [Lepidopterella palustris CBS 459.81]